ncbi:MAG: hypothetical protein M1832_005375 [Thelocarpon impressellum]|nr:MAG: hypothetical protein M1832_005375 [Thelocarpon impressellum]
MADSTASYGAMAEGNPSTLTSKTARRENGRIIDIRRSTIEDSILDHMMGMLRPEPGREKKMPTLLLYDEAGLKLFEKITYLDEYYLTNAEIEVLETYAAEIAERILPDSIVLELGSGNLRKVNILLKALENSGKDVCYYALDLSLAELQRTLADVPDTYRHVRCFGLHGTYEDGLEWLQRPENFARPKCVLSLGSSIGNFPRAEAAEFLAGFARVLRPEDSMLIGLDACKDKDKVYHAYNDREGVTHDFLRNGLLQANTILGKPAFKAQDWVAFGEYDEEAGRHHAFYSPVRDVEFDDITFAAGERVRVEESYKYSASESSTLWAKAGLAEGARWGNSGAYYFVHMLSRPTFAYPLDPAEYAAGPVPQFPRDWDELWAVWDTVTKGMIPKPDLQSKPIKLRNACIFYLGHIPCFLDLHLARATGGSLTEPADYLRIFERGIDPDVENPDHCHAHSEIPDSWPPVQEIIDYQDRVRERVRGLYSAGAPANYPALGRALWMGFEHEVMHLETMLYMLLQSDRTLPPPGRVRPDFEALAREARVKAVPNEWFAIPESEITLGLNDPEEEGGPIGHFGWDNEKPSRKVKVRPFLAKARPITNGEYASYLEQTHRISLPTSWTQQVDTEADGKVVEKRHTNGFVLGTANGHANGSANGTTNGHAKGCANGYASGCVHGHADLDVKPASPEFLAGKSVRTVFGLAPLAQALDWPVMASYDELAGCVKWIKGRIPTLEEVRSIYEHAAQLKAKDFGKALAMRNGAVNG